MKIIAEFASLEEFQSFIGGNTNGAAATEEKTTRTRRSNKEEKTDDKSDEKKTEEKEITYDMLREVMLKMQDDGREKEIEKVLSKYDVERLSAVEKKYYPAIYKAWTA